MRRFLFGRSGPEMKAIRKTVGPPQNVWDRHIFIFALNRHIGFTASSASSASRSRPQSTMLTIIADKLSAAGCSWAIAVLSHAMVGAGYQQ
jgi:hypothetical protein